MVMMNKGDENMAEKFIKGYYIKREAYYYIPNIEKNDENEIMIGLYNKNCGCRFEFRIVETDFGLRLKMYDDSWIAFVEFSTLFERLANLVKNENFDTNNSIKIVDVTYTLKDVVAILNEDGFTDLTQREKPINE